MAEFSGDVVAGRSLFFFFFFPPSAVTALEEVFITVFTAVRKDLYKYRKLIKVCFFFTGVTRSLRAERVADKIFKIQNKNSAQCLHSNKGA